MGIGLAHSFETFLLFRVLIGVIGASFVITQYHTSVMFAPNCVGTANATTAGWGNLGGGVTQMVMPLLFALFVGACGVSTALGWRLSMFVAGVVCALTGVAYYFLTQDAPHGNFRELRAAGRMPDMQSTRGSFLEACRDRRVWALFAVYGACFGLELTIDNIAALYFVDYFGELRNADPMQAVETAGLFAGLFGGMNLFARALGGIVGDRFGARWGLSGRVKWLFLVVFCEGLALMLFSQVRTLVLAVPMLMLFGLFVKMSNGATYSVVPFINKRALGSVAGIVGAGGNAGAVAAGFLFKMESLSWPTALFILGAAVTTVSFLTFAVTFSPEAERDARVAPEPQPIGPELAGQPA
jgi:NNP family nitrate/nitrite transporter-like MFS transporter